MCLRKVAQMFAPNRVILFYAGLILTLSLSSAALAAPTIIVSMELSKSFRTRSLWSFLAVADARLRLFPATNDPWRTVVSLNSEPEGWAPFTPPFILPVMLCTRKAGP